MDEIAIKVDSASKTFKLPHEKKVSVKAAFINVFRSSKGYELQEALKDISFEVKQGEFFGIVGRNGSGKSTLLKLLAGIYIPTTGNVDLRGSLTPFIELGVGFNAELTGRENVYLNGALLGFSRKEMQRMYADIVKFAELERFMDQKLKNYSSGMQVRLAFSIAIRAKSDILLIDEVLAVGDLPFQEKCYKFFDDIKKTGRTVVFVSHDSSAVERFCDRVAIVDKGELVDIGKPASMVLKYGAIIAKEQYSSVSESSTQSNRQGTGAIHIGKVSLLNKPGKATASLKFGEPFSIQIPYTIRQPIDGDIIAGIDLIDSQGISILGPNTKEASVSLKLKKSGKICAEFSDNNLSPGTYRITCGIFNHNASVAYELLEGALTFKILGEARHGKVYIEPKWSVV